MIRAHNLYNILQQILSGGSESATGEITLIIPTGGNIREITPIGNFHNNHQIILLNHQMILAVGDSSSQSH